MPLFRRNQPDPEPTSPAPAATPGPTGPHARKDRPTPSRREAEAARRQRVNRTLTGREARAEASKQARSDRMKAMYAREAAPEKALMRDFIDSRWNLGEFLLPSLVVILAISFLGTRFPTISGITTAVMYLFILAVIADGFFIWLRFKPLLAKRLPNAPTKGLALYGMNRAIQIRRFRMPAPRIKRGESF